MTEQAKSIIETNYTMIINIINMLWKSKFNFSWERLKLDKDDFDSLCMMTLCENIDKWDSNKSGLKSFLIMIFTKKAYTYARDQRRDKRSAYIYSSSIDNIDEEGQSGVIGLLPNEESAENIVIQKDRELLTKLINDYCSRLSTMQISVFNGLLNGYCVAEIAEQMGRSQNEIVHIQETLGYDQYVQNIKECVKGGLI